MSIQIEAKNIQVGDTWTIGRGTVGRVTMVISLGEKMVDFGFEYVSCSFSPERVGASWATSKRIGTKMNVVRA